MEIQIFMLIILFPLLLSSFDTVGVLNELYHRYMAQILPIRRKTLSNQSINKCTVYIDAQDERMKFL